MGPDPSALDTLKLLRSWTVAGRCPVFDEKKREVVFDETSLKVRRGADRGRRVCGGGMWGLFG